MTQPQWPEITTRVIVKPLVLTDKQKETLRFLHRNAKGTYMQLTALLDELDLLNQT